jgi:nitrogen fixation NifU-like protein
MSGLDELYQEVILDHNRSPRNFCRLDDATHHAEGHNPLCGDHVEIFLKITDGVIKDITFEGNGCAISKASASLMTERLKGMPIEEAAKLHGEIHDVLKGDADVDTERLGKLAALSGVSEFPMRVKCATLAWHTMKAAAENDEKVSTE